MPSRDDLVSWYQILGLQPGASLDAVRRAYKALVRLWHPDQYMHDESMRGTADRQMKLINIAYTTLTDFLESRPPFHFEGERGHSPREPSPGGGRASVLSRFRIGTKAWWQRKRFSFEDSGFFGPSLKTFFKTMSYGLAAWTLVFVGLPHLLILVGNAVPPTTVSFIESYELSAVLGIFCVGSMFYGIVRNVRR